MCCQNTTTGRFHSRDEAFRRPQPSRLSSAIMASPATFRQAAPNAIALPGICAKAMNSHTRITRPIPGPRPCRADVAGAPSFAIAFHGDRVEPDQALTPRPQPKQKRARWMRARFCLAGGLGFEPRLAESESAVLPLDDPPKLPKINAWRTGSRGGPCADRPSCARPHGHRGSGSRACASRRAGFRRTAAARGRYRGG